MKEIIEYLELIKNSIVLKDEQVIAQQIKKIKQLNINNDIVHIVTLLDRNKYNLGTILIDKIIIDAREVQNLKNEQKNLENTLHFLNKEKNKLIHKIDMFNIRYYKEFSYLIQEILKIKSLILKMQLDNRINKDKDIIQKSLDEANETYKQFIYLLEEENSKQVEVLSKVEKIILKDTYSEAMKLCHPDMIPIGLRNNVEEIFDELNSAYLKNNLLEVKKIKSKLNRRNIRNSLEYKRVSQENIHTEITKIKKSIGEKKVEIAYLYHNETYQRIQRNYQDIDYFTNTKKLLELELNSLNEKLDIQTNKEYQWMQVLWNWANQKNISNFPKDKDEILKIISLDISYKNLSILPEEIGMLTTLTSLNISHNKLIDIPKSIITLKNLVYLNLESNNLQKLSKNIGKLNNLEVLNLQNNELSRLPNSIGNLKNLTQLKLSYNRLSKLPESISGLENLRGLFLKGNKLNNS